MRIDRLSGVLFRHHALFALPGAAACGMAHGVEIMSVFV
jgi:hypothetical protein